MALDRVEEALPFAELSIERDPLCGVCLLNLGRIYQMLGRLDDADQQMLIASTVLKDATAPARLRAELQLLRGKPQAAREMFGQLPASNARCQAGTAVALYALGRRSDFEAALADLFSTRPNDYSLIATIYAQIGDPDTAFTLLERGMVDQTQRQLLVAGLPRPSAWMPYQNDQRWTDYLEAIDRSPERLRAVNFNPMAPAQGLIDRQRHDGVLQPTQLVRQTSTQRFTPAFAPPPSPWQNPIVVTRFKRVLLPDVGRQPGGRPVLPFQSCVRMSAAIRHGI